MDFAACGPGTAVHPSCVVVHPEAIWLRVDVTLEPLVVLMSAVDGHIRIGDRSLVAPQAYLQGAGGVRIGRDVGVGPGVRLPAGVQVGAGAVVRAQAYPADCVIAGIPARVVRARGAGDWAAGLSPTPPAAP
jgi:acetyltransferase-like isoleucine patch superfamily enzyme